LVKIFQLLHPKEILLDRLVIILLHLYVKTISILIVTLLQSPELGTHIHISKVVIIQEIALVMPSNLFKIGQNIEILDLLMVHKSVSIDILKVKLRLLLSIIPLSVITIVVRTPLKIFLNLIMSAIFQLQFLTEIKKLHGKDQKS